MALQVLDMLDDKERSQERFDSIKRLVAFADRDRVKEQFPEYFDPFEGVQNEDGTYDIDSIDDTAVQWAVPDPDEDEALSRWIAQQESGSLSAADWKE
jgi:hypothetical protein